MDFLVAAERPAEDRKASAQKAADTRAERYGDEVNFVAVSLSTPEVPVLADRSHHITCRCRSTTTRSEGRSSHCRASRGTAPSAVSSL